MSTPTIAVLAIGRRGWIEGYPTLPPALEATALGAVSAAAPARLLGPLSRMLAATVYNPRVRVQFEYERAGRYTLDDLKAAAASSFADVAAGRRMGRRFPFRSACIFGGNMSNLAKALTGLAALAFVLAVTSNFVGPLLRTQPEAYSRACTNLALLAIALVLAFGDRAGVGWSL